MKRIFITVLVILFVFYSSYADYIIDNKTNKKIMLSDLRNVILSQDIIYIGETHDNRSFHDVQLKIIRLFDPEDIVLGLEMFPRNVQRIIDSYILDHNIDEKTFIKNSNWYENWGFDYSLYKEILDYAYENRIYSKGLNIRKGITSKVAKKGLSSLTPEERLLIPYIDLSDIQHKKFVKEIFLNHMKFMRVFSEKMFNNFYAAQCIWEDVMASSVYALGRKFNDKILIILAGSGHIANRFGIPLRTFRRNEKDYKSIIPILKKDIKPEDRDISYSDYLWVIE